MAAMQSGAEGGDGQDLGGADAEDLAEQQGVDLRLVLGGAGQERGAEGEHHDQGEGGHDVLTAAPAQRADPEGAQEREDGQADEGVDAEQAGAGRAGEGALGDGVGGERRAAQHDEEADHAGDDGDDRRRGPGVHHEAGEHRPSVLLAWRRVAHAAILSWSAAPAIGVAAARRLAARAAGSPEAR